MNSKRIENTPSVEENPLFHDTWKLLKNYRDAVWNLELAIQQVRNTFEIEYGSKIEDFSTTYTLPALILAVPNWNTMQGALNEAIKC